MRVRRKHIQNIVREILSRNNIIKAPVDVKKIAESLNIKVIPQSADSKVSGFLLKDFDNKNAVIGVNSNHHKNRQRFTIAHELGHYFLHNYEGVHFDGGTTGLQVYKRDKKSSEGTDAEEREANFFAAELLMPEGFIAADLKKKNNLSLVSINENENELRELAKKYIVSVEAITYRLTDLNYFQF